MPSQTYKNILVVTDGLKSSGPTHETAVNIAREHKSTVTLVDTCRPPGNASRWFSSNANDVFEMVVADKQQRLDAIADGFRANEIDTDTKVLFGKSSEAITREAIQSGSDLVIRYMKGVRSKLPGLFGNTARSLMRYCPAPLLLVGEEPVSKPRVLACINAEHGKNENNSILSEATCLAGNSSNLFGLYCWDMYGRDLISKRMDPGTFQQSLECAESHYQKALEKFTQENDLSAFESGIRMENGDPSIVIPQFCRHEAIDVVVMCSATLNHPLRKYFGSTIESVIERIPCSLLVVKPIGFESPIQVREHMGASA